MEREDRYLLRTYAKDSICLERGEGVWVFDEQGRRYLDLYGGHAVAITGHCHPRLCRDLTEQMNRLLFYSNVNYSAVRGEAAEALLEIAPAGFSRVFFVNSGSEANENAIKLARKLTGRTRVLSFEGGFHGRTMAALSATAVGDYASRFRPLVPDHQFLPFGDLSCLEENLDERVAAVILEPVQSMAGIRLASPEFYQTLRSLCDRHGALLIYDEIQTGFGRTGDWFFAPRYGVRPDLITLAKGMASGVPMGALLLPEELAREVRIGDLGSTFGGGQLACAGLLSTLHIIREENLLSRVSENGQYLKKCCGDLPGLDEYRGMGYLIGLKFQKEAAPYRKGLLERRILTGLSADPHVLRLLPPLVLERAEIDLFLESLWEVSEECL